MEKLGKLVVVLAGVIMFFSCSDFDEQDFTVLLPDAGEDIVFFTEESGTNVNLDGSGSSDVNGLGFEYTWEITDFPTGFEPVLESPDSATPILTVDNATSGRITLSLIIARGDQRARDFINVDVNPQLASVLFVHAIEGEQPASMSIPATGIASGEVTPLSADATYHNVNLDEAADQNGNVTLNVDYNNVTLSTTGAMAALGFYTLYLTGTEDNPELILIEKAFNPNTIPPTSVGLAAANMATGVDNVVLFIDASAIASAVIPLDLLFENQGVSGRFGVLNFGSKSELLFPANALLPLPIWATVDGERISNDATITLNNTDSGQFGSFILFKDGSSEFGNTLRFVNNSALLP